MKMKPLGDSADKFVNRASMATEDYAKGVTSPKRPWKGSTLAAEGTFKAAMADALARDAHRKGVEGTSDEEWRSKALGKGKANYPTGVAAAKGDWQKGYGPFHTLLSGLELKPRGSRGSAGNYERSKVVGEAQHRLRVGA